MLENIPNFEKFQPGLGDTVLHGVDDMGNPMEYRIPKNATPEFEAAIRALMQSNREAYFASLIRETPDKNNFDKRIKYEKALENNPPTKDVDGMILQDAEARRREVQREQILRVAEAEARRREVQLEQILRDAEAEARRREVQLEQILRDAEAKDRRRELELKLKTEMELDKINYLKK